MIIKALNSPYSSKLLATAVLSTSLLMIGCSSNDVDEVGAHESNADIDKVIGSKKQMPADDTDSNSDNNDSNNSVDTSDSAENTAISASDNETISDVLNPALATSKQPSLVTNPTQAGTPEDTVKQALNTLYYGDVKKAATYYKVDIANFEQELANTQSAFQQTVEGVTITDTTYNDDKTRATIEGELMLKGQKQPAPLAYELQKIKGQWKILG